MGLSTLGRFALAPHTLPASILNTLYQSMVDKESNAIIASEGYILAQKDNTTYSVRSWEPHPPFMPCSEATSRGAAFCVVWQPVSRLT